VSYLASFKCVQSYTAIFCHFLDEQTDDNNDDASQVRLSLSTCSVHVVDHASSL